MARGYGGRSIGKRTPRRGMARSGGRSPQSNTRTGNKGARAKTLRVNQLGTRQFWG